MHRATVEHVFTVRETLRDLNYKVDSEKLSPFIKKYLKTAVASGELVQTKGKGASGSFKLAAAKTEKATVTTAPARGRAASAPKVKKHSGWS